jgi:hypothetical protein
MMTTPPKDKPVKQELPEQDELQTDEAVAAPDLDIKKNDDTANKEDTSSEDLNVDNNDIGLNQDQGDEFL